MVVFQFLVTQVDNLGAITFEYFRLEKLKLKNITFETPCLKRGFHQIDLLLFKILFDIRFKKTSPFSIHCSFKCSILSWFIFEYLVSFLIDKIKFRIFFVDGINLFLCVSLTLNPPNILSLKNYATLH